LNEIVVDTDVVSYLLNRHSLAGAYEKLLIGRTPMISFMTVAELYRGALKKEWGQKRIAELESHLRQFAVVPYSLQVCTAFAHICNSAERRGRSITTADAFIAACAVSLRIPLLTHNRRHFDGIDGLQVISALPEPAS
jgi:tRNA(fMet)-specific endonuclease VapC